MEYLKSNESFTFGMTMRSKDYGWEDINEKARKVLIVNPNEVKDLELMSWVAAFRNSGHSEWEFLWAALIVNAVREAAAEGKDEADVQLALMNACKALNLDDEANTALFEEVNGISLSKMKNIVGYGDTWGCDHYIPSSGKSREYFTELEENITYIPDHLTIPELKNRLQIYFNQYFYSFFFIND